MTKKTNTPAIDSTPTKPTLDTLLNTLALSDDAKSALNKLAVDPERATIGALTTYNVTTALAEGAKRTALREIQAHAESAGTTLMNADALAPRPRASKPDGADLVDDIVKPSEWAVIGIYVSDFDGKTHVELKSDGGQKMRVESDGDVKVKSRVRLTLTPVEAVATNHP